MQEPVKKRPSSLVEMAELMKRDVAFNRVEESIDAYRPRATDIIITPFGKSGTTWTQQIFRTLRTRGDMEFDDISRVVPWIETSLGLGIDINADQAAEPRGFKSHLSYEKIPRGARYINVIRHPVDASYSAFRFMEGWFLEPGAVSADEYALARLQDASYHKHFISWWPHRLDENVLYLVYEHMIDDLEEAVERIAGFMNIELDDQLRAITLEHASLLFMQHNKDRFDDLMLRRLTEKRLLPSGSDSAKVRLGKVGVHEFSSEVVEKMDEIWREIVLPVTGFETYAELVNSLR